MTARTKRQHYVPQFVLRRFADSEGKVSVFDKRESRTFRGNVRKMLAENRMYDLDLGSSWFFSLEGSLSAVESAAAEVVNCIVTEGQIGFLSEEQKEKIAVFAAVQLVRVPSLPKQAQDLHAKMGTMLADAGLPDKALQEQWEPMDDATLKRFQFRTVTDSSRDLAPHLLNKTWILWESCDDGFWISDAPVTRHNGTPHELPGGNLGLSVRGVEIYMPLTPRLVLSFLCPSLNEPIVECHSVVTRAQQLGHAVDSEDSDPVGYLMDGICFGFPVPAEQDRVDHLNSLQVQWGERWLLGKSGDFSLAKQMLKENPKLRCGVRFQKM